MNHLGFVFVACAAASLVACSSPPPPGNDAAMGVDAIADATAMDAQVETAADAAPESSGPAYYVPPGYELTPFLSPDQTTFFDRAEMVLDPAKHYEAVLETDAGRMVFDFYDTLTPVTVNSFVFLALNHYFDGIAFHRVVANFVAQGGDPNTLDPGARSIWGQGGPGYQFGLEIVTSLNFDTAGVVGMARTTNPNTNGSQFFITLAPTPNLDGQYTVFARVVDGTDVPAHMAVGSPPANPTRMQRVYIVERVR